MTLPLQQLHCGGINNYHRANGWYITRDEVTIEGSVDLTDDVHLILANDCDLTVNGGTEGNSGANLTIYARTTGDRMGKLTANGVTDGNISGTESISHHLPFASRPFHHASIWPGGT